jgi:hypothetical protein
MAVVVQRGAWVRGPIHLEQRFERGPDRL